MGSCCPYTDQIGDEFYTYIVKYTVLCVSRYIHTHPTQLIAISTMGSQIHSDPFTRDLQSPGELPLVIIQFPLGATHFHKSQ